MEQDARLVYPNHGQHYRHEEHLIKDCSWNGSTPIDILTGNVFSLPELSLRIAEKGYFESQVNPTSDI